MKNLFPIRCFSDQIWTGSHARFVRRAVQAILGYLIAIVPGSVVLAEDSLAKQASGARLLFREDWKTTPAELPITQEHVATKDLHLLLHGPGKRGLKKSHHDQPVDDPFYLWSGRCEERWAFSLRPKNRMDLSAPDARMRVRTKQSTDRQLYVLIKSSGQQWYISKQSIPTSTDWREFELEFADLDWSQFDPLTIQRGNDQSQASLDAVEEIGLTDLQAGGGSKASSRVDWIAVWDASAVVSEAAVLMSRRSVVASTTADGCRLEKFTLHSDAMERDIGVVVVLPPEYDAHPRRHYPILYTLHGRGAPYTSWASMAPLLNRLKDQPVILAGFDAGYASCYLDAPGDGMVDKSVVVRRPRGKPGHMTEEQYQQLVREWETAPAKLKSLYTTFFFEKFVPALDHYYRVDTDNRAVTGFSLGGFGALHYALERPAMFRSVSGLSSAFFDEGAILASMRRGRSSLRAVLGDYATSKENYRHANQFARLDKFAKSGGTLPPIYQHCGLKDGLLGVNQRMREAMNAAGCELTYKESEGSHNWTFWKNASDGVFDFHWQHFH